MTPPEWWAEPPSPAEPSLRAVLESERPVGFTDLPRIARDIGSLAASESLDWLEEFGDHIPGVGNAAVLLAPRSQWLASVAPLDQLPERPFPDELVVAAVIEAARVLNDPRDERCLIVPTGGALPGETVMLFDRRHRDNHRRTLMPVMVTRGVGEAVEKRQPCEISDVVGVDCENIDCDRACRTLQGRERGVLVVVGCTCS